MKRRTFIRNAAIVSAGTGVSGLIPPVYASSEKQVCISILHTNDTHARIEPFPDYAPKYAGLGGVSRRAALVRQLRSKNPNCLLLDAGDVFHGTPYFNKYHGALDFEVMSKMGYDAVTIGNHEFDNGVAGFERVMDNAKFPFISSNYDFGTTRMGFRVQKFIIRIVGGIKIGIFGLGVALENLVLPHLHRGVRHYDPIEISGKMVKRLKDYHQCDMVICLSHLGYNYDGDHVSDRVIADQVDGIDLIVGGHTHTFLNEPELFTKQNGSRTWISQVGFAGIILGRMNFYFDKNRKIVGLTHHNHSVRNEVEDTIWNSG